MIFPSVWEHLFIYLADLTNEYNAQVAINHLIK